MARSNQLQFLLFLVTIYRLLGAQSVTTTFDFKNSCPYTVWPGTLTAGAGAVPQLFHTGFVLLSGNSTALEAPSGWSGRLWARTHCTTDDSGRFSCGTADCASGQIACNGAGGVPPATLVELTLSGDGGKDIYDISLVDGFNLPVSVAPVVGGCVSTSCPRNVNAECPGELAVKGSDGTVISCKSACLALNKPEYCCTGAFNTSATCPPTEYSKFFKGLCPQAYSYAYDDESSTFNCTSGTSYLVTFCP